MARLSCISDYRVYAVAACLGVCACGPGLSSHPGAIAHVESGDPVVGSEGDGDSVANSDDSAGDGGDSAGDGDSAIVRPSYLGVAYISWNQGAAVYDTDESDSVLNGDVVNIHANALYLTQNMAVGADSTLTATADTESEAGLTRALTIARNNGLKAGITLVLELDRTTYTPDDADAFFTSYTQELVTLATLCEAQGCSFMSVGFELRAMSNGYATQWASVISAVRANFSGKVTYHFFNNEADSATFVPLLDVIGIDAMFPLACSDTPSVADIADGWVNDRACAAYDPLGTSPLAYLENLAQSSGQHIVLLAVGFRSEQGAAKNPEDVSGGPTDNSVQNNAWQGTLQTLLGSERPWLDGIFVWEMMPYTTPEEHTATVGPNDYTPQNKVAFTTIQGFFAP